jgi:hypothetical protein
MQALTGRNLYLDFAGVQVCAETTNAVLGNEAADADTVTFADVANGTDRTWAFAVTGVADYSQGSLWSLLWDTGRFTEIPFVYKPYGDHEPSPDRPHFIGSVLVDAKPEVGGGAGDIWTYDAKLVCTAPPVRVMA